MKDMNFKDLASVDKNNVWNKPFLKFHNRYLCPCCFYPTLNERNSYHICGLCFWEDDGQDDIDADEVLGGPNTDYSLTEARNNFIKYLTMYRPSDTIAFSRNETKISEIKEIYDNILKGHEILKYEDVENELRKARSLEDKLVKDSIK